MTTYNFTVKVTDAKGRTDTLADSITVSQFNWVVSASSGQTIALSGNFAADAWDYIENPFALFLAKLYANDGRLYANYRSTLSYSDDRGATWTETYPAESGGASDSNMAFGGGYAFVFSVNKTDRYHIDSDTWSVATGDSGAWSGVYHNGKVIVVGAPSQQVGVSVDDGASFVLGGTFSPLEVAAHPLIETDGSRLCVLLEEDENPAMIYYSDNDGDDWTLAYTFPALGATPGEAMSIKHYDGHWIASLLGGNTALSDDGVNWTPGPTLVAGFNQIAGARGRIAGAGENGHIMLSDTYGATWWDDDATGLPVALVSVRGITAL